jgi:hypothetical protein
MTNDRMMRYNIIPHTVFTDTLKSTVKSKRQNTHAQVYCTDSLASSDPNSIIIANPREVDYPKNQPTMNIIINSFCFLYGTIHSMGESV